MDRRKFIKSSTAAAISGAALSLSGHNILASNKVQDDYRKNLSDGIACDLKYRNGKLKILQLTDTHNITGDPRSKRALDNVNKMLDVEKPDFVIHTGDIVYGKPAEKCVREILQPLVDRKIPFAVALGNHDSDYDLTRSGMLKVIRTIPGNVNTPDDKGISNSSNDVITLSGAKGVDRVIYLFDSGDRSYLGGIKSWGYVYSDQIEWYKRYSRFFTGQNGGKPVPSLAFMHIPIPEYRYAIHDEDLMLRGNIGEDPSSPLFNSGLYVAMREMGDMQATVSGHDHDNDYVILWQNFFFIYGKFSGGDTVYNDLKPNGARVFEFTEGDDGFRTWVRLNTGDIEQKLYLYPGMVNLSTPRG